MKLTGWRWLVIWAGSALCGIGIVAMFSQQRLYLGALVTYLLFGLFHIAWLVYGFVKWWYLRPVKSTALAVLSTWITGFLSWLAFGIGSPGLGAVLIGVWAMVIGFHLGLWLLRLFLSFGHPICGVARTLVDEAIRRRAPLVFIVLLLVMLPIMPFVMDPQDLLRYRIQTFMTWSMIAASALLSLMTVFLAVGTITSEIQNRQILLSMSKPLSRLNYLVGKWLGIVSLNLLLLTVCGIAVYAFTMMLARQPAKNLQDRIAVHQRVLVARVAEAPLPRSEAGFRQQCQERLDRIRAENNSYGMVGQSFDQVSPAIRREVEKSVRTRWYAIGPRMTQVYRFNGLRPAQQYGDRLQLRIKPKSGGATSNNSGLVYLNLSINDRPYINPNTNVQGVPPIAENTYHILPLDTQDIDGNGELLIAITNPLVKGKDQSSFSFNLEDGLEVFYRAGSFEWNLVRSLLIVWLRLAFLAMLGLTAGTFLGFSVACLVCLIVYMAAAASGFLAESLEFYSTLPSSKLPLWERITGTASLIWALFSSGDLWGTLKVVIRLIGTGFMLLVPNFGTYNPTPLLADGRLVSSQLVLYAAGQIGLVWTAAMAVVGYLIFRSRELARVIV